MGEPVRIVDLANDLIRLSGLTADEDVEIHFTGIRPGEKLFEELFLSEESAVKTYHPRIFIGRLMAPPWSEVSRQVKELGDLAADGDLRALHAKFKEIVPEYVYHDLRQEQRSVLALNGPHEVRAATAAAELGRIALSSDPA
jgi:FlaA1/EpsC-like NDP-sugar epimerase